MSSIGCSWRSRTACWRGTTATPNSSGTKTLTAIPCSAPRVLGEGHSHEASACVQRFDNARRLPRRSLGLRGTIGGATELRHQITLANPDGEHCHRFRRNRFLGRRVVRHRSKSIGIPGLYVTDATGAKEQPAKHGNLSLRLGLGRAKLLYVPRSARPGRIEYDAAEDCPGADPPL